MNATISTNKLASLLAGMPEVQNLIAREEAAAKESALQARLTCIQQVQALEAAKNSAEAKAQAAFEKLEAERVKTAQKLAVLGSELCALQQDARDAAGKWSNATSELHHIHGEGHVVGADFILNRFRTDLEEKLALLERTKHRVIAPGFTQPNPNVIAQIPAVQESLELVKQALEKVQTLSLSASLAPDEIKNQAEAILQSTGLWKPEKQEVTA